jgi:hypothetical protein
LHFTKDNGVAQPKNCFVLSQILEDQLKREAYISNRQKEAWNQIQLPLPQKFDVKIKNIGSNLRIN